MGGRATTCSCGARTWKRATAARRDATNTGATWRLSTRFCSTWRGLLASGRVDSGPDCASDGREGNNLLMRRTNMEAGHGGASGRYKHWRDVAFEYAFLLDLAGTTR